MLAAFAFGAARFTDAFLASGTAGSGAALARDALPPDTLPLEARLFEARLLETGLFETRLLDATLRAAFAFFGGRFAARALLAGLRVPAFAVDRFFAAMSILIIRNRDR